MAVLTVGEKDISVIGPRALDKYGVVEFTEKTTPLFSVPLPRRMSNEEILKELAPSPVELGEIYNLLDTLPKGGSTALFYVLDKDGSTRPFFAFYDEGWHLVSPNDEEVPTWGEEDTLFSQTET